jgi:hypothetical protein|tara:strand:- start:167 stop:520 length:354 start_codon:yes stop_codon:yes gene_type:complete
MSCGQNHKYDAYQKASDALKAALVEALNTDEETSTLEELFQHYIGARNRADKASNSYSIYGGDSVITFGDGFNPVQAADTVAFDYSGLGTDTIFTGSDNDVFNVGLGSSSVDSITLG